MRDTPTDPVTYLAIVEQTSLRFLPWSRVSLNRKYSNTLIIADTFCNSHAGSVSDASPYGGASSPTSWKALFSGRLNNEGAFGVSVYFLGISKNPMINAMHLVDTQ